MWGGEETERLFNSCKYLLEGKPQAGGCVSFTFLQPFTGRQGQASSLKESEVAQSCPTL